MVELGKNVSFSRLVCDLILRFKQGSQAYTKYAHPIFKDVIKVNVWDITFKTVNYISN